MPIKEWKKLSGKEKVDVSFYVENLIHNIRTTPEKYINMPKTAPMYKTCFENAAKICDTCWHITVGRVVKTNGQSDISPDGEDLDVDGKNVAEFRQKYDK